MTRPKPNPQPAGRKPKYGAVMTKVQVYLTPEQLKKAVEIGCGFHGVGIRLALDAFTAAGDTGREAAR